MVRALCLLLLAADAAQAQTASAPPTFEVSSVKPSGRELFRDRLGAPLDPWMRGGPGTNNPGQISLTNASLRTIIVTAYGVKPYQIAGPAALDAAGYNIVA